VSPIPGRGVILETAPNDPVTDGGFPHGPGATLDVLGSGSLLLFESSPLAMWVHDCETLRILAVNEAAVRQYGWSRDQFESMTVLDLLPLDDHPAFLEELLTGHPAGSGEAPARGRHRTREGALLSVEVQTETVLVGGRRATLALARDVTEGEQLRMALETTGDQLREAQAVAKVGIWDWDIRANHVRWSDELYRIFGLTPQAFPATFEGYVSRVHPDDRALVQATVERSLRSMEPFDYSHRALTADGQIRWLQCRGRVRTDDGQAVQMTGACQDVTAQREAAEALSQLALHDPLTSLPNRSLFMDRLGQALRRLDRCDRVLAVLFVDLDRFKVINDRFGHAIGDETLMAVGARLREVLRPHDTVARLGGDEFVVLCEDLEDDRAAVRVAERVLTALDRPVACGDTDVVTSASIGISLTRRSDVTPDALLRDADMAMYRAKETGRHRIEVFDNSARLRNQARIQTAEELRQAVDSDQLRVVYQPIVHLGQATPAGVEALVRWQHPRRGLLAPAEFIQVAEDTGLVVPLGAWVLRQACRDLTEIIDRGSLGGGPSELVMSVNLSARQLSSPGLVPMVQQTLQEFGLAPWRLCFEITESVLMDDVDSAIPVLSELRALGVRLAIDDFGTGYSSLGYLRRFPVDIVKLDRAFVGGLGSDSAADAITAAVINLGHALGLSVIAEGVETEEQLTVLRALRCDRAQGYLWSAPQTPEALAQWMAAKPSGELELGPVDLAALVTERVQAARPTSSAPVVVQVPPTLAQAYADTGAARKVLDHLISNALKYSPGDRPVVVSAAADKRFVRISVADYGIGMTNDEVARCFEPFWQADQVPGAHPRTPAAPGGHPRIPGVTGHEPGGAGVGLYIVRSLVEAMGGHVAVRSAKGAGSTFTFALPRTAREAHRTNLHGALPPGVGEDSSIREFMRQIGVPRAGRVTPPSVPSRRGTPASRP
jgi:diguanylate cyclase (GGDEF)-like protein/PAS domain S-box-containing protein